MTDFASEFTADQLALPASGRVTAKLKTGSYITGGRVRNGAQVFLNVPYALPVPRWSDPQPLPEAYQYPDKDYVYDNLYCTQPRWSTTPNRDQYGLGSPTDNPFFADIYIPSRVDLLNSNKPLLSVKIFIHGGLLQVGSTSGSLYNGQQHCSEARTEVRVLIGYRLSVLGFLAAEKPRLEGNYGLKDVWVAIEWIRDNISSFGGDPAQIHITGMSGGGHAVAQMLHQVSRRAPAQSPFVRATLHSNAILSNPHVLDAAQKQFDALCRQLELDPSQRNILDILRAVPSNMLMQAVQKMGSLKTFRTVMGSDGWLQELVLYQRSPVFAAGLRAAGVRSVLVTEVSEENTLYQLAVEAKAPEELIKDLCQLYPQADVQALVETYPGLPPNPVTSDISSLFGKILADGQVHIPIRQLARDLLANGFPCIRLQTRFLCKIKRQSSPHVFHGSDLVLHHLCLPVLSSDEIHVANNLLDTLDAERAKAEIGELRTPDKMLLLKTDGKIDWVQDEWYEALIAKEVALPRI